jgi:hypothetical protein
VLIKKKMADFSFLLTKRGAADVAELIAEELCKGGGVQGRSAANYL